MLAFESAGKRTYFASVLHGRHTQGAYSIPLALTDLSLYGGKGSAYPFPMRKESLVQHSPVARTAHRHELCARIRGLRQATSDLSAGPPIELTDARQVAMAFGFLAIPARLGRKAAPTDPRSLS